MATHPVEHNDQILTATASGAITVRRFVTYAGAQATAGAKAMGVSLRTAASGEELAVVASGTVIVEAGAAVSIGASVTPDANGKAVTATSGDYVKGTAMTAASADGDMITIHLEPTPILA